MSCSTQIRSLKFNSKAWQIRQNGPFLTKISTGGDVLAEKARKAIVLRPILTGRKCFLLVWNFSSDNTKPKAKNPHFGGI